MHTVETTNLEDLLNRIKQEGVDQAQMQAEEIINEAQAQAEQIVNEAKREAAKMRLDAEKRIQTEEAASLQKLSQSARDLMIGLEAELKAKIQRLTESAIDQALTQNTLQEALLEIAKGMGKGQGQMKISFGPEIAEALGNHFVALLAKSLKEDAKIAQKRGLGQGFFIEREGEDYFYDFSAQHLATELSKMALPRLKAILGGISQDQP